MQTTGSDQGRGRRNEGREVLLNENMKLARDQEGKGLVISKQILFLVRNVNKFPLSPFIM